MKLITKRGNNKLGEINKTKVTFADHISVCAGDVWSRKANRPTTTPAVSQAHDAMRCHSTTLHVLHTHTHTHREPGMFVFHLLIHDLF